MKMFILMSSILFGSTLLFQPAQAGCNPACPSGQQCRYEASGGGYFYCEALDFKEKKGSGKGGSGKEGASKGGVSVAPSTVSKGGLGGTGAPK